MNLLGAWRTIEAFLPLMRAGGRPVEEGAATVLRAVDLPDDARPAGSPATASGSGSDTRVSGV